MVNQTVDLRVGTPIMFGSDDTRIACEKSCREARASMTVEYQVAPGMRVLTKRGWLNAGAEIKKDDFVDQLAQLPDGRTIVTQHAWHVMESHLTSGRILSRAG